MNEKEINRKNSVVPNSSSVSKEDSVKDKNEKLYSNPNETSCSPEFSEGCISRE